MIFTRQSQQVFAILSLNVSRIDDCKLTGCQTFSGNKMQHREGVLASALVIFIVGDQSTTEVRRENLSRLKMSASKGRFATARRPNQNDQCKLRDIYFHVQHLNLKRINSSLRRWRFKRAETTGRKRASSIHFHLFNEVGAEDVASANHVKNAHL